MKKPSLSVIAAGIALGLLVGASQWAIAQTAIRLFGTTSTGTPRAVLVNSSGAMVVTAGGAGAGAGQFPVLLTSNATTTGTGANTTETDLWTYSLPAGTLSTNLWGVRIKAWGTTGANANNKTFKVYFGATQIVALSTTANASGWTSLGTVLRTAAATQQAGAQLQIGLGTTQSTSTAPAETLSGAVTIKVTGQNGSAVANDCVFRGATVELLR